MKTTVLENRFVQGLLTKSFRKRDKKTFISKQLLKILQIENHCINDVSPYPDMVEFSAEVARGLKTSMVAVSSILKIIEEKEGEAEIKQILRDKEDHRRELNSAVKNYPEFKSFYSSIPNLTHQEVVSKAIAHCILNVCFQYIPRINSYRLGLIFDILREEKKKFEDSEEKKGYDCTDIVEYHCGQIRLTSLEAFIKFVKRKKKKTLPEGLKHGHSGKVSNNYKWTESLKWIVTLFSISRPTHVSAGDIQDAIENLLEDNPGLRDEQGIIPLDESTISKFLREEAAPYISFAKDDPLEFKRKIVGVLRFYPPSAPLVKVGIDGYVFQCISEGDDESGYIQLLAVKIKDIATLATLGIAINETEDSETVLQAWREYFTTTKGEMAREIAFDGHLAYQSKKTHNFLGMIQRDGVDVKISKHANYQARFERSNLDFQDKYLANTISYIGPGIKSKGVNAHPSKIFKVVLRSKEFLKDKQEMKRILYHLVREEANLGTLRKRHAWTSPMKRFISEEHNPLKVYEERFVAFMTYEHHFSSILGCGVIVKKDKEVFVYNKRDFNTATKLNGELVDVYIKQEDRHGPAHVFKRSTTEFLIELNYLATIPEALFDRTDVHKDLIKIYGKDVVSITDQFEDSIVNMRTEVTKLLKGKEYEQYLNAAKIKKRIDTSYVGYQLGVSEPKLEPAMTWANSRKSRIKRRAQRGDESVKGDLFDTY
jgi:hypothetical protein